MYKEFAVKLMESANNMAMESDLQAMFAEWQIIKETDETIKAQKQANADLLRDKAKKNREATELFKVFLSESDLN